MKLKQVRSPALRSALAILAEQKLPMVLGYKVNLVREQVTAAYNEFEKNRISRAIDLADKNENGEPILESNQYVLSAESLAQLNKEISELEEEEITVPKLSFNQFPATVSMTANEIAALSPLIGE